MPHAEAAWLFKIAANVCHERRRSAWRRSRIEAVSDDGELRDAVAPPTSAHDELAGLADALAELTPNQRRAILLREWQGLSYREIAAELETTEAAVETLLFRARRSLARKLDRSRGRVRGLSNLGSVLAWGKTLLGGTRGAGRGGHARRHRRGDRGLALTAPAIAAGGGTEAHASGVRAGDAFGRRRDSSAPAGDNPRNVPRGPARDEPGRRAGQDDPDQAGRGTGHGHGASASAAPAGGRHPCSSGNPAGDRSACATGAAAAESRSAAVAPAPAAAAQDRGSALAPAAAGEPAYLAASEPAEVAEAALASNFARQPGPQKK